ncbi:MAG TPA: hypothetical protein VJK51_05245, partial [Candidatus Nanoarchaeia archaeon]|nr:hypothetical protein [Candidatus Nanoarchaeia archaeon]
MRKIVVILLIFLLLIPTIFALEKGTSTTGETRTDTGRKTDPSTEALAEQIHQEIENTIRSDATLDLQSPKYRDHPEIVKQVLKDKYGLDIN